MATVQPAADREHIVEIDEDGIVHAVADHAMEGDIETRTPGLSDADLVREIQALELKVRAAEDAVDRAKHTLKTRRATFDRAVLQMREFIRRMHAPLPLFDAETAARPSAADQAARDAGMSQRVLIAAIAELEGRASRLLEALAQCDTAIGEE